MWSMEIAKNVESDHHPLIINIKERMEEEGIRRKGKREKRMSREYGMRKGGRDLRRS